jgi:type IV secretion system protein TrbG
MRRWWVWVIVVVVPCVARGQDTVPGDALAVAAREVRGGLAPRVVDVGGALVFPYGHGEALVTCAERRVCVVGVESGERVVGTTTGDGERWLVSVVGNVVAVKPTQCGIASDLVIATDRRVYTLALVSAGCVAHGRGAVITPYVRFWYPDAVLAPVVGSPSLNFSYHWTRDPHIRWTPAAVYDDGVRVFIRFSDSARHEVAPVLWEETGDGDRVVINYRVDGDAYVTDRVFARGVLEASDGRRVRRVEIVNARVWPEVR